MSDQRKDGGPAFPSGAVSGGEPFYGMSLRDWFAGQALVGLLNDYGRGRWDYLAEDAFNIADEMLKARETNNGEAK